ncbi:response regulator [Larkinella insperata]|uniref:Response regulator n=1 Tax=Larkinella insperata TaxID=332158 RepID=A0ABW3Q3Q5_9BACT|nr:response regulator [Larkinella insperata]
MNRKQTILIVDDNATYRQLLTIHLTKAGYEVLIAKDGQEAIDWLLSSLQQPDLILLDLLMPQKSGIEVLENIKASRRKLPVILMSGAEMPIARQGVIQSTPDAFLPKPFEIPDLLQKIENLLKPISEVR